MLSQAFSKSFSRLAVLSLKIKLASKGDTEYELDYTQKESLDNKDEQRGVALHRDLSD